MDSVICFESRSTTMADILSSRSFCGEFDETSFMVEIGSFHQGLQEENETALRNLAEYGGDECDGWLVADLPNSNSLDATYSGYCTGAPDIGIFGPFSNHINFSSESCSSDDDLQVSAAHSFIKECHSTSSLMSLPLSRNLRSESLPMSTSNSTGLLKLVAGQSFPTENMVMNENCDVISEHYPGYEQRCPERGTIEEIERNWQKRKTVDQDINREFHCLRKRLSTGERSGGIIAGEMAVPDVNNCPTARPLYVGSTEPNSDGSALRTARPALNAQPKPRARRGSATDPQSVYARNRRERINERLKTLQNLVPNGTKVDISTMLEQAIQYVTFMQLQIKNTTLDRRWQPLHLPLLVKLLRSDEHWMYTPIAFNGMEIAAFGGKNLN